MRKLPKDGEPGCDYWAKDALIKSQVLVSTYIIMYLLTMYVWKQPFSAKLLYPLAYVLVS